LEETLTGKGKKAVVLGDSLPENLWVAQACGCGGWPWLPTDGELRRRSLAVAQGGSGHGRRWFKLKGEKESGLERRLRRNGGVSGQRAATWRRRGPGHGA
jgi:hypothetical protein